MGPCRGGMHHRVFNVDSRFCTRKKCGLYQQPSDHQTAEFGAHDGRGAHGTIPYDDHGWYGTPVRRPKVVALFIPPASCVYVAWVYQCYYTCCNSTMNTLFVIPNTTNRKVHIRIVGPSTYTQYAPIAAAMKVVLAYALLSVLGTSRLLQGGGLVGVEASATGWSVQEEDGGDDEIPRGAPMVPPECSSVYDVLKRWPDRFSIMKSAVDATSLESVLDVDRLQAIVFLPTDEAFVRVLESHKNETLSRIAENVDEAATGRGRLQQQQQQQEEEEELQQQQQLPPQQQQLQPPPEEEEEEEVQHMGVVTPESVLTDLVMLTKVIKNHIIPLKDMDEDEVMESGVCYPTMAPGECILVGDSSDGGVILQSSGTELKSKVSFLRY